jgi:sugar phosphate isomerase/epimerase
MSSKPPSACACRVRAERIISLAALTVLELPPPEMIAVAARCGYSHVGLRLIPATPAERHFALLDDAVLQRDTVRALADHGIALLDIEILRLKPDTKMDDFEAALAFGAALGARFALVAGNDPDLSRTTDNFAALCDRAARYDIRPHLEFMPWTHVPDIGVACQIAAATGRADAGVLIDAFHLNRSGGTVADVPEHDPRFGYVQLCDIAGPVPAIMDDILHEARAERLFPGDGDCPLAALLQRLAADIPISIETPAHSLRLSAETRARRAFEATCRLLDPVHTIAVNASMKP